MEKVKVENEKQPADKRRPGNRFIKKPSTAFEGRCDDLKGHVFEYGTAKQADMYMKTRQEIADYVGQLYKNFGHYVKTAINNMEVPVITRPTRPPVPEGAMELDEFDKVVYAEAIKHYARRQAALTENLKTVYSIVWGQCSDPLRPKAKAVPGYEKFSAQGDIIKLLKAIQGVVLNYQSDTFTPDALIMLKTRYYNV